MLDTTVFKAYDIRGTYPEQITLEIARVVGMACTQTFPEGEIIVGYDARHGSSELASALTESIEATATQLHKNTTVRQIGISTTPMFYFLVNHFNAIGGCMITASHNPKNYNGIKTVRVGAEMISGTELLSWIQNSNKINE